jgi:hypothetical protein
MNADKEFVLAHWDNGIDEHYTDDHQFFFIADIGVNFDSWSSAAEFTRSRLEEIWQVEEEIHQVEGQMEVAERTAANILTRKADWVIRAKNWQSILARLQAALTELKRGLK